MKIYEQYFEKNINYIINSLKSIDEESFLDMLKDCEKVLKTNRIVVSGLGKNVPIAEKFVGTMVSLGFDAAFMNTNSAMHGDLGIIKKNDLVIILTKSGSTTESIELYNELSKRKVNIWLITCNKKGVLSKKIKKKIVCPLEHEGDLWNIVPNNSTTLNMIILQSIAIEMSKRYRLSLEKNFKPNHPGGSIGALLRE